MKVYTIMLEYKESDVLVFATTNYEQALDDYHKQIRLIDSHRSNAVGVKLFEWKRDKAILLQCI